MSDSCSHSCVCSAFDGITAKQLVMWERPVASGAVIGGVLSTIFLFGYMEFTFATLLCRVMQLLLVAVGAASYMKKLTLTGEDISAAVQKGMEGMVKPVSKIADATFKVLAWEDGNKSIKVLVASILLGFFGNCISDLTLLFIVTVAVFTVPLGYTKNQAAIDPLLNKAIAQVNEAIQKVPIFATKPDEKKKQ